MGAASVVLARQGEEESPREVGPLQRAEPRRVGRRHVDHDEVGDAAHRAEAREVVVDDRLDRVDRDGARLPDREPDGDAGPPATDVAGEAGRDDGRAGVREPQTVDERAVVRQTEEVRRRVRLLGLGRHGPELEEPEAEGREGSRGDAVLVESAGEADGRRETQPEPRDREAGRRRVVGSDRRAERGEPLERRERSHAERMGVGGWHREQQRAEEPVHRGARDW